jgi:hypothetical protein
MNNTWILLIFIIIKAAQASKRCDVKTAYTGSEIGANSTYYKYYCIKCDKKSNTCERCKYGETLPDGGCNTHANSDVYRQSSRNVGNIENCEGAKLDPYKKEYSCFMCSEGFALVKNQLGLYSCESSNISRCIVSEKEDNQEKCMICRNSVPSQNWGKCEDKGAYKLDDNCEFVMRHPVYNNKSATCVLCYQNYALVPRAHANGSRDWGCRLTSSSVNSSCPIGCAKCNEQKECLWCSHYHGYYMTEAGVCSYYSQLAAFSTFGLTMLFYFL